MCLPLFVLKASQIKKGGAATGAAPPSMKPVSIHRNSH
jgi:hypothetical protein